MTESENEELKRLRKMFHETVSGNVLAELDNLKEELAALQAENEKLRKDAGRLDFLEGKAKESRTGVTLDHHKYVEDGTVIERGFRVAWFHNLNSRHKSLRDAIDAAMKGEK